MRHVDRRLHHRGLAALASLLLLAPLTVLAVPDPGMTLLPVQTGGIFADGGLNNSPGFQNYFVGYGTSPGLPRTAQRRSFFVFSLAAIPPDLMVVSATLKLRLPFGGLIFGKGPGDPLAGPVPSDISETFALGAIDLPSSVVLSPTLDTASAVALFGVMDDHPVASPTLFMGGGLPPAGDGGPPIVPVVLDGAGLSALNAKRGGEIVLTGWMPSWTEDLRPSPTPPPLYFEASELIFGLTDVHALAILTPKLELMLAPVPEPASVWLGLAGLSLVAGWPWLRRRRAGCAGP